MADQKFIQYGNKKMPMGSLTLEQAKQTMARFFPELAEPKIETKKDGDDTIYVFTKQAGRKGGAGQEPAEIWTVDQDERVDGAHQVVDHDGMTIAFMATGGDAEETLERAYLIAAAPAMYAALEQLEAAAARCVNDAENGGELWLNKWKKPFAQAVLQALTLARGESQ